MQAIQTEYNGYKFRSRLEARWAVFFDKLGVIYEYEPEGFDLGEAGWYLPDFYLPQSDIWLEIKPATYSEQGFIEWPDGETLVKATAFAVKHNIYVIMGTPDDPWVNMGECKYEGFPVYGPHGDVPGGACDSNHFFCRCPECKKLGIKFEARSERIPCDCKNKESWQHGKEGRSWGLINDTKLRLAYKAAKQARFEHGETPDPRSD